MAERTLEERLQERINLRSQRMEADGMAPPASGAQRLEERIAIRQQRIDETARRKKAKLDSYDRSMIGEMGADPESAIGYGLNVLPDVGTKIIQGMGRAAAAPFEISAAGQTEAVTPEQLEAYDRLQRQRGAREASETLQPQGTQPGQVDLRGMPDNQAYSEQDAATLAERAPSGPSDLPANHPRAQAQESDRERREAPTALERLDSRLRARDVAETIRTQTDATDIAYDGYRQDVDRDLLDGASAGLDKVGAAVKGMAEGNVTDNMPALFDGAASLLANMGNAFKDNPKGFAQMVYQEVAEDVGPALLMPGGVGLGVMNADNLGLGAQAFNDGIENFIEQEGRAPNAEETEYMAHQALLSVAANTLGDAAFLKLGRLAPSKGVAKVATDVIAPAGRLTRATTVGAASEGLQTQAEGEARHQPASAEDIYLAAATGAGVSAAGATPSAAAEQLEQIGRATRQGAARAGKALNDRDTRQRGSDPQAVEDAQTAARESGDVSELIDPDKPSYAPREAMEVLVRRGDDEAKDTATRLASDMEARVGGLREAYDESDAGLEDRYTRLRDTKQAELDALAEDAPDAQREKLRKTVRLAEKNLRDLAGDEKSVRQARERARAEMERAERELQEVMEMRQGMNVATRLTPEQINEQVEAADMPENPEAVSRVIRLAMESPASLDPARIGRMAANTANSLSDSQRAFLARFSESQAAANALKGTEGVSTDVFQGGEGFVGIEQYRDRFTTQLRAGNDTRAQAQLAGIESFAQQREEKAAAAQAALEEINASNGETKRIDLVYDPQQGWQKAGRFLKKDERERAGALVVTRGTSRLLDQMGLEAEAVRAASNELQAAYTAERGDTAPAPGDTATSQQANNEATQETANAETAPAEAPPAEPAAQDPVPEAEPATAEPAEPAPATDESVDQSPEPTPAAAVVEDDEAAAQPQAEEDADGTAAVATDEETDLDYDPVTGEVIEETPAQNFDPETRGEGGLSVLRDAVKRASGTLGNEAFRAVNLVKQYVRQDDRETARRVTRRPLVEVRNFLTQLGRDESLARKFTAEDLSEKQQALVSHLASRLKDYNASITESLPTWNPNHQPYFHQDFIQFFRDAENGELDENTLTAISMSAYTWLGENARKRTNDNKAINRILGRQTKKPLTAEQIAAFRHAGHRQNRVIDDLGKRAAEALGLTVDNGVPQNILPQIHGALGGRALAMMRKEGLVEVDVMDAQTMARLREERLDERFAQAKHPFVRIPLDDADPGRQEANEIADRISGTQSLLSKLFGTQDSVPAPSMKKVPFRAKTAKRSPMQIPEALKKILAAENAKAHYVREDMLGLWSQLDENTRLRIAGGVDPERRVIHVANRSSIDGKNEALTREVRSFDEFVTALREGEGTDKPFYLDREVWKMQRVGLKNSLVNPQGSKVHRHLVKMGGWDHTVQLDNGDGSLDQFFLAVADALGIKTDGQTNEASLQQVQDTILEDAVFNAGVIAIMQAQRGEAFDAEAIEAAVAKGGEAMHSLDGLVGLAHYLTASDAGESRFTHTLTREVDGKTNGPMLAQWLLGAAGTAKDLLDMTIRGGFFTAQDGVTHIGEWAADKANQDLYQKVAKRLTEKAALSLQKDPRKTTLYEALYYFTGDLATEAGGVTKDGRKFVKTPVTALQFGSASSTVVEDMGLDLVNMIHDRIEKIANLDDPAQREAERVKLINAVNTLRPNTLAPGASVDQLVNHTIQGNERTEIQETFRKSLGQDIAATMEEVFEPFIKRRQPVNKAAGIAYELYDIAYRHARREYLKELARDDRLAWEKHKGKPLALLEDLTPEQEAEVERRVASIMPRVHTPFSKAEGNLDAGLYLGKRASKYDSTQAYHNTTKLPKGETNVQASGQRVMNENPGVGALIWMIHSGDSYIAASTYAQHQALNVHDALIIGLDDVTGTGQDLNRNTLEMLRDYSPAREVAEALERTLAAFDAYADEYDLGADPQAKQLVDELNQEKDIAGTLGEVYATAQVADRVKLEALGQLSHVSQYTVEGGQYAVTAEDRQAIQAALEAIQQPEEADVAKDRAKTVSNVTNLRPRDPDAETQVEPEFETVPAEAEISAEPTSEYAEQPDGHEDSGVDYDDSEVPGSPATRETAQEMLSALEADRGMSPQALIDVAMRGATPAVARLLQRLKQHKLVGQVSVNIHDAEGANPGEYVRSTMTNTRTGESSVNRQANINLPWLRARVEGLRPTPEGNSEAETIAEVIAHELVHAATAEAIYDEGTTGKRLNRRLEGIQTDIKAWMAENPTAVEGLDSQTRHQLEVMTQRTAEIPAYGMTAKRIQTVLKRIPSRQSRGSAWTRFVKAVREALNLTNTDPSVLDEVIAATDSAMRARTEPETQGTITLQIEEGDRSEGPMAYSTRQIFDSLAGRSDPALVDLLDRVVSGLHGPYGAFKERAREAEAVSPEDVFLKALAKGQAPFVSESRTAGFALDDQQAFVLEQVEATLRASMEVNGTNDLARRELHRVWKEAKAQIGPEVFHEGDWSQASQWEKDRAQAKHDYVFTLQGDGKDHLARFGALAMVYPPLRERMDFATARQDVGGQGKSLTERLRDLFNRVLELFHGRLTKTYAGQRADDKVWSLMDQLVDIEARRRARLQDQSVGWQDRVEDAVEGVTEGARARVVDFGRSHFFRERRNGFVRAAGSLSAVVAGDRVDELFNNIEQVRNRMFTQRQGVVASLVSEARGAFDNATKQAHTLLRRVAKANEQERVRIADMTRQGVLEAYADNGRNLSQEDKAAITRVILDTDMASLTDRYTQEELTLLVEDTRRRKQAIRDLESELRGLSSPWIEYYLGSGRELGWHMATGDVVGQHLMLNAHNIAGMGGTKYQNRVSSTDLDAAQAILDPLISLYALDYSSPEQRSRVGQVMRAETQRGEASGVLTTLMMHKRMQEDALEKLFDGQQVHMQKGYRAQIYNPYKTVTEAPLEDRASYEAMGYTMESVLPLDPNDPDQVRKGLFVLPDGGLSRRVTGTVSYTNEAMRGTAIHGGTSSVTGRGRFRNNERKNREILKERDTYIDGLVRNGSARDPSKATARSYLAPNLNPQGEVVNYRYLMKQETKDKVLDRNNAMDDVMGAMAGHAFDKVASKEQNRRAIQALKDQFDAEYQEQPTSYVRVSAGSKDKQLAEAYRLLPDDAKKAVQEIWGGDEMWVRVDLVDINFGYQKPSLANTFKKAPEEREGIEKIFAATWETLLGKKAYLRVRQAEDVWAEIVKELKDILVIKTGLTLLGNVVSNVSLLVWHGVPVTDMARNHRIALEGVVNYRRDHNELLKLQQLHDAGRGGDPKAIEQRIRELQDALDHNPVAFMIEEGLMPTIVEDVDMHDDPYSYKSQLAEKTEKWTGKVWKPARTAGRYLYMTHDTPLYKALSQGTQVSDFVARYTLYQHLIQRKRKRMDHDAAIQRASDMFINYDVPTHRMVQYLNDMGLLRFTKYYIRIQRAILTLYREQPARALLVTLMDVLMPGLSLLTDSQAWERIGNPIEPGALDYPGVLDELATVKAGLSPFN